MPSLKSYSTALTLLEKVLEHPAQIHENTLFFTTSGMHISKDGEEIWSEIFFFGLGSDIYSVKLYEDGGEIQRLDVIEAWSVTPPEDNGEDNEEDNEEEEDTNGEED